jgi:hypothetical protein
VFQHYFPLSPSLLARTLPNSVASISECFHEFVQQAFRRPPLEEPDLQHNDER